MWWTHGGPGQANWSRTLVLQVAIGFTCLTVLVIIFAVCSWGIRLFGIIKRWLVKEANVNGWIASLLMWARANGVPETSEKLKHWHRPLTEGM